MDDNKMTPCNIIDFKKSPVCVKCDNNISKVIKAIIAKYAVDPGEKPELDDAEMKRRNVSFIEVDSKRLYVSRRHIIATRIPPGNTPHVCHNFQLKDTDLPKNITVDAVAEKVPKMENLEIKKEPGLDMLPPCSIKREIECVCPELVPGPSRDGDQSSIIEEKPNIDQLEGKGAEPPKVVQGFSQNLGSNVEPLKCYVTSEVKYLPGINQVVQLAEGETKILKLGALLGRDPLVAIPPVKPSDHPAVGKIVLSPTKFDVSGDANVHQKWKEHNNSRSLGQLLPIVTRKNGSYKTIHLAVHTALLRPEARPVLNSLKWLQIARFCATLQLPVPYQVELYEERADLNILRYVVPIAD